MIRATTGTLDIPVTGVAYVAHVRRTMGLAVRVAEREQTMLDVAKNPPSPEGAADKLAEICTLLGVSPDQPADAVQALAALQEAAGVTSEDPGAPDAAGLTPAQLSICRETGCSPAVFAKLSGFRDKPMAEHLTELHEREANAQRLAGGSR
jgi:hypothetical protein